MSILFQPTSLAGIAVRNRFVRSATWEGLAADDGAVTQPLIDAMVALAEGEIGLIISSHAYVAREGQAGPRQLGVYDDRLVEGLANMADQVHRHEGRIVLQLAHAGIRALRSLTKQDAVGPSPLSKPPGSRGRAMTADEIEATIEAFAQAARRAKEARYDGVQIHAAHGYLLSQFLSPHFNQRDDDYGGELANRARIVLDVLRRIKALCGGDFPVLIKINCDDFLDDGFTVDGMVRVVAWLEEAGLDAVELSGGVNDPECRYIPVREGTPLTEEEEVYYREAARQYKAATNLPLILVGGIRSFEVAEELVQEGLTDFVALSRPLIREPNLIARWKAGDRSKSECGSCNGCFEPIRKGEGFHCVQV